MGSQQERTERMEILRGLIERLGTPDLTLAEVKVLRGRISDLLEWDNQPAGGEQRASPRGRGDGSPHVVRSPQTTVHRPVRRRYILHLEPIAPDLGEGWAANQRRHADVEAREEKLMVLSS
jgi:hypothetical protein